MRPPWSCNWTSNINVQMNYWHVETCNLSELHQPLIAMVQDLSVNGKETARVNYGAPGWVSHHNVDLWRQSAPVGMGLAFADPTWAKLCDECSVVLRGTYGSIIFSPAIRNI